LADIQRISLTDVTGNAGVQLQYLGRIEKGLIKVPNAAALRKMTESVNGSWEDVGRLLVMDDASSKIGRQAALEWAVGRQLITDAQREVFLHASDDRLRATAARLRRKANQQN
jgi:hypothetical protein